MATIITSECINCGACEPECPNTAIYAAGVKWELDGVTSAALNDRIFYIAPSKCTECVGFHDHEACAAVCPVDCCIPDPNNPESEEVLLARARKLHPDETFGPDAPSRFRKGSDVLNGGPSGGGIFAGNGASATPPPALASAAAAVYAAESPDSAAATAAAASRAAASAAAAAASAAQAAASAAAAARAVAASASINPTPSAPAPAVSSEFDRETWEVPIICHQCNAGYAVPYNEFQVDAYFFCPACSAAFTPGQAVYEEVRRNFEWFFGRRKREREEFERRRTRELQAFEAKQNTDKEAFTAFLDKLAQQMKPAGKPLKPKARPATFS